MLLVVQVDQVIWATAHTTQFTRAGFHYLSHGSGVGQLDSGGTYVSFTDPYGQNALTIVVEAMTKELSGCVHEDAPDTNVTAETANFRLTGKSSTIQSLHVWQSQFDQDQSHWFVYLGEWMLNDSVVTLDVQPNSIYTLSTIRGGKGQSVFDPPDAAPFPFPYADNFDSLRLHSQAPYFTDQSGSFEVVAADPSIGGNVVRQMMPRLPVSWCGETPLAYSVMGSHDWRDINVTADAMIEDSGTVFIAAAVTDGGCLGGRGSDGFTFAVSSNGTWTLSNDTALAGVLASGKLDVQSGQWYRLNLIVAGTSVSAWVAGKKLTTVDVGGGWRSGWAAIGSSYDYVQFDNFSVTAPSTAVHRSSIVDGQRRQGKQSRVQDE